MYSLISVSVWSITPAPRASESDDAIADFTPSADIDSETSGSETNPPSVQPDEQRQFAGERPDADSTVPYSAVLDLVVAASVHRLAAACLRRRRHTSVPSDRTVHGHGDYELGTPQVDDERPER